MGTIALVTVSSALSGALIALGLVQAGSGRMTIGSAARYASWTVAEVKLTGVGWVVFGLAGIGTGLLGGLELGAKVIPLYWVGSPWGFVTGNPFVPAALCINLFIQLFIALRHRRSRARKNA